MIEDDLFGKPFGTSPVFQFDIETARSKLDEYDIELSALESYAESVEIKNDLTLRQANEISAQANAFARKIQQHGESIYKPYYSFYKRLLGITKELSERPKAIQKAIDQKILDYQAKKEIERRDRERKAEAMRQAQQAELDKMAAEKGVDRVELPDVIIPAKTGPLRSESGTLSIIKFWDFEIVDPDAVPRKYLKVDEAKIREAIQKGGIRHISGVRIFENQRTQRRTIS